MRQLTVVLALLICASCSANGKIEPNVATNPDDAIFLIGVETPNAEVAIYDGTLEDGTFLGSQAVHFGGASEWTYFDPPKDGYIIARAPKNRNTLATAFVRLNGVGGKNYGPCHGPLVAELMGLTGYLDRQIVFTAKSGTVTYVTNVRYELDKDGNLISSMHADLNSAREFLSKHYPLLADKLVAGIYETASAKNGCY